MEQDGRVWTRLSPEHERVSVVWEGGQSKALVTPG